LKGLDSGTSASRVITHFFEPWPAPGDITILLHQWTAGGPPRLWSPSFELVHPTSKADCRGTPPGRAVRPASTSRQVSSTSSISKACPASASPSFSKTAATSSAWPPRLMRASWSIRPRLEGRQKTRRRVLQSLCTTTLALGGRQRPRTSGSRPPSLNELEMSSMNGSAEWSSYRFFSWLQLPKEETADLLSASKATVDRDLKFARRVALRSSALPGVIFRYSVGKQRPVSATPHNSPDNPLT